MSVLNVYPSINLLGLLVLFSIGGSGPRAGGQSHTSSDVRYEIEEFSKLPFHQDAQDLHLSELFSSLKEVGLLPKLGACQVNGVNAPVIVATMSENMTEIQEYFDNTSPILVLPIPNQYPEAVFLVMRSSPDVMYVAYTIPVTDRQQLLMITPASQIAEISGAAKIQRHLSYDGHLSDEPLLSRTTVLGQSIFMFDDYKVLSMSGELPGSRAEVELAMSEILVRRGFEPLRKTIHGELANVRQNESSVTESADSSIWIKDNRAISIQVKDLGKRPTGEYESMRQDLDEHFVGLEIYETYSHSFSL